MRATGLRRALCARKSEKCPLFHRKKSGHGFHTGSKKVENFFRKKFKNFLNRRAIGRRFSDDWRCAVKTAILAKIAAVKSAAIVAAIESRPGKRDSP